MPAAQVLPRVAPLPQATVVPEAAVQGAARSMGIPRPRSRTSLAGVGVVLALLFVGLFCLSQTFEAAAARYRVDALLLERQGMQQELQSQQSATLTLGSMSTVTQWAQGVALDRLDRRVVVRAR